MAAKRVSLPEALHSKIGPSSSERWMHCPASVGLTDKLVKQGKAKFAGSAAKEGTAAHSVLAACLQNGKDAWEYAGQTIEVEGETFEVDGEMTAGVQSAIDFVRKQMDKYENVEWIDTTGDKPRKVKGAVLMVETMLSSILDDDAFGTGDVLILVPGVKLIVDDFKYGQGIVVEPADSQLKIYSSMAWEMFSQKFFKGMDSVPVEQWILQPRIPHPRGENRDYTTDSSTLTEWYVDIVVPAMQETRNPNAIFQTGGHCHFCPARNACPALRADTMNLEVNRDPVSLTPDELGELLERIEAIVKYGEKLKEEALARARQGEKIKGFKLVKKQANRIWKDQITIADYDAASGEVVERVVKVEELLKETFGDGAYTTPALKGPPGIEELPGGEAWTTRCAYSPDTGTTLAKLSDKRSEVRPLISLLDARADLETP
jgi:hypothetical protein